jgi:hypothetical protein
MSDDFFDNAEVTKTFKAGKPGTIRVARQKEFPGKLVRVRYYKNIITGENRKTYEIDPTINKDTGNE